MQDDHALPAELTIYVAADWHARCLGWLNAADPDPDAATLALDASAVAEVDAAGVQLLTALANALARPDRRLRLVQPSAVLARVCTQLGAAFLLTDANDLETTA